MVASLEQENLTEHGISIPPQSCLQCRRRPVTSTTGHDKDTVMLACLGDGTKLPPYVVFKRKTLPKNMVFPHRLVVRCQEKGWMNEDLVKDWLNTVSSKVGGLSHRKSMLVWDSFCAHLSNLVRRTLQSLNTECAVIPGGMKGILQPLDVSINKPFKDRLRNKWQQWMISGEHTLTASGRMRKAELNVICNLSSSAVSQMHSMEPKMMMCGKRMMKTPLRT